LKTANEIIIQALKDSHDEMVFGLSAPIGNLIYAVDRFSENLDRDMTNNDVWNEHRLHYWERIKQTTSELKELINELDDE